MMGFNCFKPGFISRDLPLFVTELLFNCFTGRFRIKMWDWVTLRGSYHKYKYFLCTLLDLPAFLNPPKTDEIELLTFEISQELTEYSDGICEFKQSVCSSCENRKSAQVAVYHAYLEDRRHPVKTLQL